MAVVTREALRTAFSCKEALTTRTRRRLGCSFECIVVQLAVTCANDDNSELDDTLRNSGVLLEPQRGVLDDASRRRRQGTQNDDDDDDADDDGSGVHSRGVDGRSARRTCFWSARH